MKASFIQGVEKHQNTVLHLLCGSTNEAANYEYIFEKTST